MRDVGFVVMVMAFFAVAAAYVQACASVVGAEPAPSPDDRVDQESPR